MAICWLAYWTDLWSPVANKPIRKALSTWAHSCIVYCLCEGSHVSMSCLTTSHGERFVHNLLGKTRIFQRRFIKSRTQCACFSDLLPLPMYPHRMSKCLFGKLLWGKACKGLGKFGTISDSISQFVSAQSLSAKCWKRSNTLLKHSPEGCYIHTILIP